jgi:AraC family transcriptional activator of pobA
MQTLDLSVCDIGLFGNNVRHFWLDDLNGLLQKFPELEFPHKQDFYILIIAEEAEGEIIIDNHKIRLDSAKAIVIKPRCINRIDINRKAKGKIICFTEDFFSLRYNNNILYQFSFLQRDAKPFIRLSDEQKDRWSLLLSLIADEHNLKKRETKKVLRSYLNIILFELERLYNPVGFLKSKNIKQEKVHEFELLIDKHFEIKKLPSAYAELLNVSPNYLNKICKEETGQTAGDLIRKRITIEAQRLLHYTFYSINEIADKLGFENTSYFITFFKKQTETTPEQFRKHLIN